jgi:hypothetical protein
MQLMRTPPLCAASNSEGRPTFLKDCTFHLQRPFKIPLNTLPLKMVIEIFAETLENLQNYTRLSPECWSQKCSFLFEIFLPRLMFHCKLFYFWPDDSNRSFVRVI